MPRFNEQKIDDKKAKVLLIGMSKAGKTHWVAQAAAAGYNLIYLDGDVARQTLMKLPEEAQKRIFYFSCEDSLEQPRFGRIVEAFMRGKPMLWNDTDQRMLLKTHEQDKISVWEVMPTRLGLEDIIVIDSWTALADSVMRDFAIDEGLELGDVDKRKNRDLYGSSGAKLTAILQLLKSAPCHVVVLAHADEYSHYKKPTGVTTAASKEADQILEWTRLIPKSSSKPHGLSLARNFNEVLWIEPSATRPNRYIDGRVDPDREGGGSVFSERKSSEEYSLASLIQQVTGVKPEGTGETPGIVIHSVGEYKSGPAEKATLVAPDSSKSIEIKNPLAGLTRKKGK